MDNYTRRVQRLEIWYIANRIKRHKRMLNVYRRALRLCKRMGRKPFVLQHMPAYTKNQIEILTRQLNTLRK